MRRSLMLLGLVALVVLAVMGAARPAGAHPLGNATINHYAGLRVEADRIEIDYVLDLAEIPTFQERSSADLPPRQRCAGLVDGLELLVDGRLVELSVGAADVAITPGEGDLDVTRIECTFAASIGLEDRETTIAFRDDNHAARLGWREITAVGVGTDLHSPVPSVSVSDRLTTYPDDGDRPDVRSVELVAAPGDGTVSTVEAASDVAAPTAESDSGGGDPLLGTLAAGDRGVVAFLGALLVAAGLGAVHGMAPGHGKTVIGAFLVATRGTRRQAVWLTLAVAVSHTLGVFLLGAVTVVASSRFAPERVYPYLQLVSAAIVLALGAWILGRVALDRRRATAHDDAQHDHRHDRRHDDLHDDLGRTESRQLAAVGARGHDHHHDHDAHHEHDHHHDHHHHDHGDGHGHGSGWHTHGLLPHRHGTALRDLDPASGPLSARALLAIGLSGGLVPSTSAVLLLLGAVQLERLLLGGLLVIGFGLGMAVALVGTGLGIVAVSRRATDRLDLHAWGQRITSRLQPVAGVAMLAIGGYLVARALMAMPA